MVATVPAAASEEEGCKAPSRQQKIGCSRCIPVHRSSQRIVPQQSPAQTERRIACLLLLANQSVAVGLWDCYS